MEFTQDNYTREEVESLFTELTQKFEKLEIQLVEQQTVISEKEILITDLEGEVANYGELKEQNLQNQIKSELKDAGLGEEYMEFVTDNDFETAKEKINKLAEINISRSIENSYRPQDHRIDTEYEQAEKRKDTQGMLKNKLSKFFS